MAHSENELIPLWLTKLLATSGVPPCGVQTPLMFFHRTNLDSVMPAPISSVGSIYRSFRVAEIPLPPVGVKVMSRGTTLTPAGNVPGAALTRLKSNWVGGVPELICIVLFRLPKDRATPPRSVRLTVPSTSNEPAEAPLCWRIAPGTTVKSVLSVSIPRTDASTGPVPLSTDTPLTLLTNRPPKFFTPLPVMTWAAAPLKVTVLALPVNTPVEVKAGPTTLKLCAPASTALAPLMVKLPNVVVPAPERVCAPSAVLSTSKIVVRAGP